MSHLTPSHCRNTSVGARVMSELMHKVEVRRGGRYFGIVSYFRYVHYTEWLNMDRLGISKNRLFRY